MNEETPAVNTTTPVAVSAMPFGEVFKKLKELKDFFTFDGRARRGEYWTTYLLTFLPLSVTYSIFYGIAYAVYDGRGETSTNIAISLNALSLVFMAGANLIVLPVLVRRLHDLGLAGILAAAVFGLNFLPYVGMFLPAGALIALGCIPGKSAANSYGTSPVELSDEKPAAGQEKLFAVIWAVAIAAMVFISAKLSCGFLASAFESAMRSVGW